MVTILLLGELGKRFGRRHKMAVASAAEAVRALCANFSSFERELVASGERGVGYRVLAGRDALTLDRLHEPSGQQRITIAPVVSGAGGNGLGQILVGCCADRRVLVEPNGLGGGRVVSVASHPVFSGHFHDFGRCGPDDCSNGQGAGPVRAT